MRRGIRVLCAICLFAALPCRAGMTAAQRLLAVTRSSAAAPVLISSNVGFGTSPVGNTSTFTVSATGAGHLLIVGLIYSPNLQCPTTVTDNAPSGGNTYTEVAGAQATDVNSGDTDIWYATNSKANATTLTIYSLNCGVAPTVYFLEFSNLSGLDGSGVARSSAPSSTTVTAPTVTTTSNHSVVFSVEAVQNTTSNGMHSGSPFTQLTITGGDDAAYYKTNATGTYGAVWDQSPAGTSCSSTAAFK